ncbi:MAG: PAS domain S-box protein [Steroidobacteraceae bacterium]|nr:PAS domain S-box protein [Steroidobacteraceae bacterium]
MPVSQQNSANWLRAIPAAYLVAGLAWILGSDLVVGWLYRDDLSAHAYASTLKGALFVTLTSVLLYVVVAMRPAKSAADSPRGAPFALARPLLAFVGIGLGIAAVAYVVYLLEADVIRTRAAQHLTRSAEQSAGSIALWNERHIRSMRQVAGSPLMARALLDWRAGQSGPAGNPLRERLEAIQASQGYSGVVALAADGTPLLAVGAEIEISDRVRRGVAESVASGRVLSTWGVGPAAGGDPLTSVEFMAPLGVPSATADRPAAVIIGRSELRELLPILMQSRAAGLESAMNLLVRRDGGQTVQLAPLVTGKTLTQMAVPQSRSDLAVVRASAGHPDVFAALGPQGTAVIAAARPVAGTPWVAVATAEAGEIERRVSRAMLLIMGMSAFGFLAAATLVLSWWRSARAGAGAQIRQAEMRADEMAARLGWVTRHANDVILLLDPEGNILDANDRAEQTYGYSRDELLRLSAFRLRPDTPGDLDSARDQLALIKSSGALVFEAIHARKDGTRFPVEVSSRLVEFAGKRYVQSIIRDISERVQAGLRLRDSEAQYRLLFRASPQPMWVYDIDTMRFLAVNDAALQHYGFSEAEFLAMTVADIRPEEDRDRLQDEIVAQADDVLRRSGVRRHRLKDGTVIDVEATSHWIEFDGRRARLVMVSDITSRVRAEQALRASEERYRHLFEHASDGIMVLDPDGCVLDANPELESLFGYTREDLLRVRLSALLDDRELPRLRQAARDLRQGDGPPQGLWVHKRKDGSVFSAEVRIRLLPGGNLLATVRDLTEILAARQRIERQRDLYDLLSQCNQAIVRVTDRETLISDVARLAVERGRFLFAWVGEVDAAGSVVPVARYGEDGGYIDGLNLRTDPTAPGGEGPTSIAIRGGESVIVNDYLTDSRAARWHDRARARGIRAAAAFPIRTRGEVWGALMLYAGDAGFFDPEIVSTLEETVDDVSHALDALQTRRELEDNRILLQSLIDASDALIYAFDLEGRVLLMNDAFARAMGGDRAQLIGRVRDDMLPRGIAQRHRANDQQVIATGRTLFVEERNLEAAGEQVYISVKCPLRNLDGQMYAVGGISTNITELRRMQRELEEANGLLEARVEARTREAVAARERAEAADRAKTLFLGSMSHELRSPLHSIIGFTSVLLEGLEGELAPAQQQHLQVVSDASQHLLAIINDLLDMSRIEAGAIALECRPVAVHQLLQRVMQRFRLQAQAKGLDLTLESGDEGLSLMGDERRIEQIVSNFVANAIKYTAAGAVIVRCQTEDDQVRIDVSDTGPGISAEDQKRLFRRFSQLSPAHGSLTEGAGLGLAIASGLADAMGGSVLVASEPGQGSVFSLLLPIGPAGRA